MSRGATLEWGEVVGELDEMLADPAARDERSAVLLRALGL